MYFQGEEVPLIVFGGLNMFCKETQNHRILHTMMTFKGIFKGGKQPAVALCSVGRPNKECYNYKKVDQSDNLTLM